MSEQTYFLSFEGVSEAEANRYAAELREALLNASAELEIQRQRKNPLTQDLGTTLVLILGAPAVVAAVQVIGSWLQKRRVQLRMRAGEEEVVIDSISERAAVKLVELFFRQNAEKRKVENAEERKHDA